MLFYPNFVLVNFILFRDIRLPNQKTSVLFTSAYIVPDTFAIYYPTSVTGPVWVHLIFWKEHLVLCQGVFSKKARSRDGNKVRNISKWLLPTRWSGSFIDMAIGIKNWESTLINLGSTSYITSISICWVHIGQDLARVCPFLFGTWLLLRVEWQITPCREPDGAILLGCEESWVAGSYCLRQTEVRTVKTGDLALVICFCHPCFLLSMLSVCLFAIMNRSTKKTHETL